MQIHFNSISSFSPILYLMWKVEILFFFQSIIAYPSKGQKMTQKFNGVHVGCETEGGKKIRKGWIILKSWNLDKITATHIVGLNKLKLTNA